MTLSRCWQYTSYDSERLDKKAIEESTYDTGFISNVTQTKINVI